MPLILHGLPPIHWAIAGAGIALITLALLFLAGGVAHEIRNPAQCQCIATRRLAGRVQSRASTVDEKT